MKRWEETLLKCMKNQFMWQTCLSTRLGTNRHTTAGTWLKVRVAKADIHLAADQKHFSVAEEITKISEALFDSDIHSPRWLEAVTCLPRSAVGLWASLPPRVSVIFEQILKSSCTPPCLLHQDATHHGGDNRARTQGPWISQSCVCGKWSVIFNTFKFGSVTLTRSKF